MICVALLLSLYRVFLGLLKGQNHAHPNQQVPSCMIASPTGLSEKNRKAQDGWLSPKQIGDSAFSIRQMLPVQPIAATNVAHINLDAPDVGLGAETGRHLARF